MRHLPAIVSGPGRWVLPIADRSAALLAEVLTADDRAELSTPLAEVLRNDPPLALWAVLAAVGAADATTCASENSRHTPCDVADGTRTVPATRLANRVGDLAAWLAGHLPAVLQFSRFADRESAPAAPEIAPRSFAGLLCESLCLAAVVEQLASDASSAQREQAVLVALLHNAPAWLARSAVGEVDAAAEPYSHWRAAIPAEIAELVVQAGAILAGDGAAPGLDLAALRRRAEQETQAWLAEIPGAGRCLPQLAARLARLEQLEHRFRETLEYEKLEAMAELAAGAGHEINNPLAIIAGRAQLFLKDETDPERRREAAIIVAQVKRAHEMIADMRLFARPPRPETQPFDLVALIDGLLAEAASQAAERATPLIRTGHPGPLIVELDPVQISVAVHALVRNALEAIGHGGRIEVGLNGDDASVTLRVADNGPGIAPEHRGHIFDPFFSARQAGRGLGMGLSKCWRIVTNHGGRIDVDSQPGQGAAFAIRLPRRYEPAERPSGA